MNDKELTSLEMLLVITILSMILFGFPIIFRILWTIYPNLWTCSIFWVSIIPILFCGIVTAQNMRRKICIGVWASGFLGNATATLANGGFMPVLGKEESSSIWIPLTDDSNLIWLCDIHFSSSIGDICLLIGFFGILLNYILEQANVLEQPITEAK